MVGPSEIGLVFLLPSLACRAAGRWHGIGRVVQPGIPFGRNARGFDDAVIYDPPLAPAAGDRALVLIVAMAFGIGTDQFAAHFGEEPRAESHEQDHTSRVTARLYACA